MDLASLIGLMLALVMMAMSVIMSGGSFASFWDTASVMMVFGGTLGAMLPPTRKEDELLGPVRDRFADDAKHAARSGYDAVAETGREVTAGEHDHDTAGVRSTSTASTTSTSPSAQPGL